MGSRISWDEYFMRIARLVSERSTCLRRAVGVVAVRDKRILATGYNGPPSGLPHCRDVGCLREEREIPSGERHEICRGLHGEQNVIIQGGKMGIPLEGATFYITGGSPCLICMKMILNTGIEEVIFEGSYPDDLSLEMAKEARLKLRRVDEIYKS